MLVAVGGDTMVADIGPVEDDRERQPQPADGGDGESEIVEAERRRLGDEDDDIGVAHRLDDRAGRAGW